MWTLVLAIAAALSSPHFAAPPTYGVECTIVEVFPGGASTPLGRRVFYLHDREWRTLRCGETLLARIDVADTMGKKLRLNVTLENSIEVIDKGDGVKRRTNRDDACAEVRAGEGFFVELPNANGEGGRYVFEFRWRVARPAGTTNEAEPRRKRPTNP